MADPILQLSRVGVFYRRKKGMFHSELFWALHDVSFNLYAGETLGVIGRNGAGKSTLLQLLAGILEPDRGDKIAKPLRISLLSLQAGFLGHLNGWQNAVLSCMLLGLKRDEIEACKEEILAFSELGDFIYQPVRSYSTGMRARLGFSVAFQIQPDVLLLDEVLGVGDEAFREKSSTAMRNRIRSDATIVLVSHNAPTIERLCDRVVWIDDGRSVMEGKPDEVLSAYNDGRAR